MILVFNISINHAFAPASLYLPLPLLIWSAVRLGGGTTTVALSLLSGAAIAGTLSGLGPFASGSADQNLLELQYFLVALCSPLFLLTALVQEQKNSRHAILSQRSALQVSRERNTELASHLVNAQEAERSRLAAELHDDVCQQLAIMSISLSRLKQHLSADRNSRERAEVELVQEEALRLGETLRQLSRELHPAAIELAGIVASLGNRCKELARASHVQIHFDSGRDIPALPAGATICIFRIAQEAISNALRHSGADNVYVSLGSNRSRVILTVFDNGHGFDRSRTDFRPGLGLITMEERARTAGGVLRFSSSAREGTTITAEIPTTTHEPLIRPQPPHA
jgi:signal transduction histidine kinase